MTFIVAFTRRRLLFRRRPGDFHVRVHDHLAFFSTSPRFDVEEFVERSDAVFVRVDAVADSNDEVTSLTDSVRVVVVREEDLRLVAVAGTP